MVPSRRPLTLTLTLTLTLGQMVPSRRATTVTCAAPASRAVRTFSMAKAPQPKMTTFLPCQWTWLSASAVPSATLPPASLKAAMPGHARGRGRPTRSLMASTTPAAAMMRVQPVPPTGFDSSAMTW